MIACPPTQERLRAGLAQPRAQHLHDRSVRPHFDLPSLGIARAVAPHRAVAAVAAKTFGPQLLLGGAERRAKAILLEPRNVKIKFLFVYATLVMALWLSNRFPMKMIFKQITDREATD